MEELKLDAVREELSGLWDWTRAQFWMTTAQTAARDGQWETATNRLLRLAGPLNSAPTGSPAWKQLATQSLETAVRTADPSQVEQVANVVLEKAWPSGLSPHDTVAVMRSADRLDALSAGARLGELLERRYAGFAWGPYAAAHFAEREAVETGSVISDPQRIVRSFELAAELFAEAHQQSASDHCSLRAAVLRMTATPQTDAARAALRELDPDDLNSRERVWYAIAQANSPFWLDRVRAADWVGDEFDRIEPTDRPDVVAVAETLFTRLPVQLAAAEADRLRDLAASFEGDARWELEAQIRGREAVEPFSDTPLDEFTPEEAVELQQEALPLDGFTDMIDAWHGREPTATADDVVAARVVTALVAMGREEPLVLCLRELADTAGEVTDGQRLRPLSLVFPRACASDPESDDVAAELTRLATIYARRAPSPSYGFTALAAALFDAGLWEAGARVTHRAINEGESQGAKLDAAVARSIQWAVREGSDRQMLEWLEIGHRLS